MNESVKTLTLNDGLVIPHIGFGTAGLGGSSGVESIISALDLGYRLIDSAFNYENEGAVGRAVKQSLITRDEILITSKLPGRHHQYKEALRTIEESLYRTNVDYYDLYLIHWPNPKNGQFVEAWEAMIEARKRGLIRSIGVCNFLPEHLDALESATGVLPSINQIELHPNFNQEVQRVYDREKNIVTESWSPLGRGNDILRHPVIDGIATRHGKSTVQVILRWHIQLGCVPLPRSSSALHQADNLDVFDFELTEDDMALINGLTQSNGRLSDQDPAFYEEY